MKKIIILFSSIKLFFYVISIIIISLILNIYLQSINITNNLMQIIINLLGLNKVYETWWFKSLLIILIINIFCCTIIKIISFLKYYKDIKKTLDRFLSFKNKLSIDFNSIKSEKIKEIISEFRFMIKKFESYNNIEIIYAIKGILGKIGFFILHLSVIVIVLLFYISSLIEKNFFIDISQNQRLMIPYSNFNLIATDVINDSKGKFKIFFDIYQDNKILKKLFIPSNGNFKINQSISVYCIDINLGIEATIVNNKDEFENYLFLEGDYILLNNSVVYINKILIEEGIKNGNVILDINKNGNFELNKKYKINELLIIDNYIINFKNILTNIKLRIVYNPISNLIFLSFLFLITGLIFSIYIPFREIYIIIYKNKIEIYGETNKMVESFLNELEKIKNQIQRR